MSPGCLGRTAIVVLCAILLLSACGKSNEQKKARAPTVVTVAQVTREPIEITQETVGYADSESSPVVSAEVAGRIVKINVDVGQKVVRGAVLAELDPHDQRIARDAAAAEVMRVQALVENQKRLVERYRKLVAENFVSQTALENNESQLAALREQEKVAKAQLESAQRNLAKTRILAPVAGRVEQRLVTPGDYVSVGKAMFQIATSKTLLVHLLFPETVAPQLRTGLPARLTSPAAPGREVAGRITDIRPTIGSANRAIDVIVEVANPGDWRPGASVNGAVIVGKHQALLVPELGVVLRPAGEVVYAIHDGVAEERVVKTGARQNGKIEIISGVRAGDTVAVDGAAFLTDKAQVVVRNNGPEKPEADASPPASSTPRQEENETAK